MLSASAATSLVRSVGHPGSVRRVAFRRLGAAVEFLQPRVQDFQHRYAVAVLGLVIEQGAQRGLLQPADPMSQVSQGQLVVVGERQLVVVCHAYWLPEA